VCSDILKPGGYGRLRQYLDEIARLFVEGDAHSIDGFVTARGKTQDLPRAGLKNLEDYASAVVADEAYKKSGFPYEGIKIPRDLTSFDCIQAPCVASCPVGQDVPGYMHHTALGNYQKASNVILETNPFPNVQGMVCDHLCQYKCTRMNYDNPLLIREIKRFIAQKHDRVTPRQPASPNGLRVAVIGAGPSGLACAYFLALAGFAVEVYETKDIPGGMAADGIPRFRLDDDSLKKDIEGILALGVRIHHDSKIDVERFEELRSSYDYVYIAVGAQKGISLGIPGEDSPGVYDQLGFLSAVRRGQAPELGQRVVVIGGGNSAVDAARTARRLVGQGGRVSIVYRRSREHMPADAEEIQAALCEGIELIELTAPECLIVEDGRVKSNVCFRMKLGEKDASGRPQPIKIEGSEFEIEVDSVISAIGQQVELDFFPGKMLHADPDTFETQLPKVFAGGDAVRGASTLVKAIGDGKRVAEEIRRRASRQFDVPVLTTDRDLDITTLQIKQAQRSFGPKVPETELDQRSGFDLVTRTLDDETAQQEARRCLQCDVICNICTTVCPNRANIGYTTKPVEFTVQRAWRSGDTIQIEDLETERISQGFQIINLGDFCNECGNCTTFCPTSGEPYHVKPRFHLTHEGFAGEQNGYMLTDGVLKAKVEGELESLSHQGDTLIYETRAVRAELNPKTYGVEEIAFFSDTTEPVDLRHGAHMAVMLTALSDFYLFNNEPDDEMRR
jgi:putative selenate reductase